MATAFQTIQLADTVEESWYRFVMFSPFLRPLVQDAARRLCYGLRANATPGTIDGASGQMSDHIWSVQPGPRALR